MLSMGECYDLLDVDDCGLNFFGVTTRLGPVVWVLFSSDWFCGLWLGGYRLGW